MMLKRGCLLVVLCMLLSGAVGWGQQEVIYPSPLAAVPSVLVFVAPVHDPGVATQNLRVANTSRDRITFQPWTVKGWVSTSLPSSVTLGALASRRGTVSVDWTRMEPLVEFDPALQAKVTAILQAQGLNYTPTQRMRGAIGAVALDPGRGRPITWVLVIAINSTA